MSGDPLYLPTEAAAVHLGGISCPPDQHARLRRDLSLPEFAAATDRPQVLAWAGGGIVLGSCPQCGLRLASSRASAGAGRAFGLEVITR